MTEVKSQTNYTLKLFPCCCIAAVLLYLSNISFNPLLLTFDAIEYFQVLQHESGQNMFLMARPLCWQVCSSPQIKTTETDEENFCENGGDVFIQSASLGGMCAADPSNAVNKRFGLQSWQYCNADRSSWHDGGILVTCLTHS